MNTGVTRDAEAGAAKVDELGGIEKGFKGAEVEGRQPVGHRRPVQQPRPRPGSRARGPWREK